LGSHWGMTKRLSLAVQGTNHFTDTTGLTAMCTITLKLALFGNGLETFYTFNY